MAVLALLLLVGMFLLWVSNRDLKRRIETLELRLLPLEAARDAQVPVAQPIPEPRSGAIAQVLEPTARAQPVAPVQLGLEDRNEEKDESHEKEAQPGPESLGVLFERLVGGRLLIWLGGIALVVAAVFLIRYSIEIGLITPSARMVAAGLFGLALVGAGELARNSLQVSKDERVAQALVGAGISVLYATAYGSYALYGLFGAASSSAAMTAITLAALGLSLRHGTPTAVLGLVGGFATPLLVGNPDAGAITLLFYLALLDAGIFLVAWRRGWSWLGSAAIVLSLLWVLWLMTRPPADALAGGWFALAVAGAGVLIQPPPRRSELRLWPLGIAALELAALVSRSDLGIAAWALFGALGAATMALGIVRRELAPAVLVAAILALLLLVLKAAGHDPQSPVAAIGIALLFGAGCLALCLWRPNVAWSVTSCIALAGALLVMRGTWPELMDRRLWGLLALLGALGPAALVWRQRSNAHAEGPADSALWWAGACLALLAGAAAWDLVPPAMVAAAWLLLAFSMVLIARRLGDYAVMLCAIGVAVIACIRAVAMVPELPVALLSSLAGSRVLAPDLPDALDATLSLALPAALLGAIAFALPRWSPRPIFIALCGTFTTAALYVWFKLAFGLADHDDFVARGLLERVVLTQALFGFGWLLRSGRLHLARSDGSAERRAGSVLTVIAAARLVWFDLLLHNPLGEDQWVGSVPVFNLVTPDYLFSAAWLYLARRRSALESAQGLVPAGRSGLWLALFMAALVTGAGLLVRQAFHGPYLTGPDISTGESYGYSLAGLLVSIGLLLGGMRIPDKALRLAGLALLTATILKVFLVDASQLEGVLRILSFLGLGVALIAIGRLYGPILRAEVGSGQRASA
jgi:uncharacterized membrane protein